MNKFIDENEIVCFLPDRRENENCGTLTPTRSDRRKRASSSNSGSTPTRICVATAIKS